MVKSNYLDVSKYLKSCIINWITLQPRYFNSCDTLSSLPSSVLKAEVSDTIPHMRD